VAVIVKERSLGWTAWIPRRRYFVAAEYEAADQLPDRIPRRAVLLVRPQQQLTWLALDCPCTRRHRLLVNLDPGRSPTWSVEARPVTISPSIDVVDDGVRCHFTIRHGRVRWAKSER
jgi:hypothetical protein